METREELSVMEARGKENWVVDALKYLNRLRGSERFCWSQLFLQE